jgi:hypothetical protein
MTDEKRYMINPDISCGDEGAKGAVLFKNTLHGRNR